MFTRVLTGVLMASVLATGSIVAGQNTGGDKGQAHADSDGTWIKPTAVTAGDSSSLPAPSPASKTSKRDHNQTEIAARLVRLSEGMQKDRQ